MASKAEMNGHTNGDVTKNIKKESVESAKKCEKTHTNGSNGMNGDYYDKNDEEVRGYEEEEERIKKLTR